MSVIFFLFDCFRSVPMHFNLTHAEGQVAQQGIIKSLMKLLQFYCIIVNTVKKCISFGHN